MDMIDQALASLHFGDALHFDNLTVTPLLHASAGEPDYLTLDEALSRGAVRITETSEAGEVPQLRLENPSPWAVLLLDGEELVGAKQNRVLNLSILAPAGVSLEIPVSCVEAGRWSRLSDDFRTQGRAYFASGRARKADHVTQSLRGEGSRRSRQDEVWRDIAEKGGRMGSRSSTGAMAGLFESREGQVEAFVEALVPVPGQVGAVFAIDGEARGLELFDSAATLHRLWPKLIRSYALDALDENRTATVADGGDARALLAAVTAAAVSEHPAVGEGTDLRLSGPGLSGGALAARGRLLHLSAFREAGQTHRGGGARDRRPPNNQLTLARLFREGAIRLEPASLFEQPLAPKGAGFDFDRVEGMLLGVAIGDALGITTEGALPTERRRRHGELRDYVPNRYVNLPRGFPSDDTQLSFWTLEQLIADGGLVPAHLARRLASGHIFGIGQTVRSFLRQRKAGRPWYACGPESAGNGALMRIAPVLVPHLRGGGTGLWADAALAAMLTHNERASTAACVAFSGMLWELLDRDRPPAPAWWLERYVALARNLEGNTRHAPRGGAYTGYRGPLWRFVLERVGDAFERRVPVLEACNAWHSGAYLLETLPSVLYILMRHADDPEEAIVRAVNDTKDNDTVAAVVGAAVGALHGRRGLPRRWIDNLSGRTTDRDDGRVFELIAQARATFWDRDR